MPKIPGVNCEEAVRAFQKLGYRIVRQGRHVILSDGATRLSIPRQNPVNARKGTISKRRAAVNVLAVSLCVIVALC